MPSVMGMTGKLGDILLAKGWISRADLQRAAAENEKRPGERFGATLERLGLIEEDRLREALALQYDLPFLPLSWRLVDRATQDSLSYEFQHRNRVVPMFRIENELTVAVDDPTDVFLVDEITRLSGLDVQLVVTSAASIDAFLENAQQDHMGAFEIDDFVGEIDEQDVQIIEEKGEQVTDLEEVAGMSPVVRLVNYILYRGIKDRASDIHVEPQENALRIRCRVDGELCELMAPPHRMHPAIVSRIKVMSDLDISERRKPQDGRFRVMLDKKQVDVRVSTLPTVQGEKVVMRLLDRSTMRIDLHNLGIGQARLTALQELIQRPDGIILVAGPTGSGKTTSLYAILEELNSPGLNLCTVENPVEFSLRGVNQVQANVKGGLGFADTLRALLRQDPDVIMIGEIRDTETATIAVQASLTGHLVLATLHTNDAVSAVTRLFNMGIEPYLISAALRGVMSQRLVRRLCPACRKAVVSPASLLRHLGALPEGNWFANTGCEKCNTTGFQGRIGLYELLVITDDLADLISTSPSLGQLRAAATEQGLMTLLDDGIHKAREGITSLEEITKVVWA
jgi:type IV pilus assembly protein PilB